jgi:hypothetical protein
MRPSPHDYGVANPISAPVCGEPVALSVKVIVPARFVPRADVTLLNLTDTVHVVCGAKAAVQVLEPGSSLKK